MHPVLFQFGNITLYTYGFFVALGFFAAITFAGRRAKKYSINQEDMSDLFFIILVSSILGARVLYIIVNFNEFASDPVSVFKIWNGGLVFYGGFIGALIAAFVFVRIKGLPLGKTADIIAPAIALGHALGRIGCFFAGCCYGQQCDLPWAVTFKDPQSLAPLNVHLHPTQLYEAISNFVLFIILVFADNLLYSKRKNKHDAQNRASSDGCIFWCYIFLYGLSRSFIEIFRGDPRGDFILSSLSVSQGIGIAMSVVSFFMIFYLYRIKKNGKIVQMTNSGKLTTNQKVSKNLKNVRDNKKNGRN